MFAMVRSTAKLVKCSLSRLFLGMIYFYRYVISPITPSSCRYHPTCSEYGLIAIRTHGAFLGGWLTIKRIFRCNPFFCGGYDPVPERSKSECCSQSCASSEESRLD